MKNMILGLLVGMLASSAFLIPLLITEQKDKYEFGHNQGQLTGKYETWEFLDKYFHTEELPDESIDLFGVKDLTIYVVKDGDRLTIQTK